MTQLSYYGTPPPVAPHRAGLVAWGAVMIAGGALFSCGGIFGMVAIVFVSMQTQAHGTNASTVLRATSAMLAPAGMYGAMIWLGIGCCQGKRWVRPLVLIGCVNAMASGILMIVPMIWGAVRMVTRSMAAPPATAPVFPAGGAPPPIFAAIGSLVGIVMMFGIMIIVPVFMFRFFRQASVKQSLETTDPMPRWTDGVPLPLLGWVVGSVVLGLGDVLTGLNGVAPFFTTILLGPMATVAMVVVGSLLIIGGVLSYRRSTLGWAISFGVTAFMAASMWTFVFLGDSAQYQTLILSGFGPAVRQNAANSMVINPTLVPALIALAAVGYGIWLRPRVGVAGS